MIQFILKRLGQAVVVVFLVTIITFILLQSQPARRPSRTGQGRHERTARGLRPRKRLRQAHPRAIQNLRHQNCARRFRLLLPAQPVRQRPAGRPPAAHHLPLPALHHPGPHHRGSPGRVAGGKEKQGPRLHRDDRVSAGLLNAHLLRGPPPDRPLLPGVAHPAQRCPTGREPLRHVGAVGSPDPAGVRPLGRHDRRLRALRALLDGG